MKTSREKEVVRKIVREILLQEHALNEQDPLDTYFDPDDGTTSIIRADGGTWRDPMDGYKKHPIRVYGPDELMVIPSPIRGVEMYQDVKLNPGITDFITRMRANLDKSVPMTITSGDRSPPEQAAVMFQKHKAAGGGEAGGPGYREIKSVYRDESLADELYSVEPSVDNWLEILRQRVKDGKRPQPHERSVGVDIRTKGLAEKEVSALVNAAKLAGGKTLLEKYPPHLHVTI
jgi:hypothetical protein